MEGGVGGQRQEGGGWMSGRGGARCDARGEGESPFGRGDAASVKGVRLDGFDWSLDADGAGGCQGGGGGVREGVRRGGGSREGA